MASKFGVSLPVEEESSRRRRRSLSPSLSPSPRRRITRSVSVSGSSEASGSSEDEAIEASGSDRKTVNKISHLLKLADEYQAKGVLDLCVKCLQDVPKSEENAVKILFLATDTVIAREDDRLDSVRRNCEILIKDIDLVKITEKSDFKNLSRDSLESVFVKRTERLETFIKDVYPQLVGLVEYCLYLKPESSSSITRCPLHFPKTSQYGQFSKKAKVDLLQRVRGCLVCRGMIKELISSSIESSGTPVTYCYGGNCHFDQKLITLLQDLNNVITLPILGGFR